jgi:gluconokinase
VAAAAIRKRLSPRGAPWILRRVILALDIGTSSTRTALFDERAQRLEGTTAQEAYPLRTSAEGAAEIDPAELLGALRICLAQTMSAARANRERCRRGIAAIGASCFWHSIIGADAHGRALTPVITWADARCREDAAELRETFSERQVHARTGCMLRASFWPAKLAWLRRTQGRLFARVRQWMSPAEWLQHSLCGGSRCAFGMATGTGLLNPTTLAWDRALLAHAGLDGGKLRPLGDEPVSVGGALAREFPELAGVPWFPAIGDGAASNLGSGATRPGFAAINVGTSAALRVMHSGRVARAPLGLFCYRVDAQRFVIGGAVSDAGNLRAWCLRELRLPNDEAAIERALAARPGPAPGLTVLPFWTIDRAPTWNDAAVGVIHGVSASTTALDLLQAITEASYQRIARIAELVLASETAPPKFIVSGGIQRSPAALQRLADVLGRAIFPNDEMEASIRGAAIFALEKLGRTAPPPALDAAVKPRANFAKQYAAARARQRALEKRLR